MPRKIKKTKGGIDLPEASEQDINIALVVSAGDQSERRQGDIVAFDQTWSREIRLDPYAKNLYFVVPDEAVFCTVSESEAADLGLSFPEKTVVADS